MPPRTRATTRVLARWGPSIVLGLILCAAPLGLWRVPLRWFFLKSDDFVYIARSRSPTALRQHLLTPHNGHVAPLFMVETHVLARLAGTLEALPAVLGWASYLTLALATALSGHVVARETGRMAWGLAAMAAVGLSSVLGPTLLWYAAGQALAAGTTIVAMLAALRAWRIRGSWRSLALGLLAAMAAPLFWSAGYAAGPVGMAYLWADGRRACRRAAVLLAACTVALIALVWCSVGREFAPASRLATRSVQGALPVGPALAHSAQAVSEALILNNLGLDAATTPAQGFLFCALLGAFWAWTRRPLGPAGSRPWPRINPLEAAGAVAVFTTFGMIFAARGTESDFGNLRMLGWYDAIAQLGAVLFVFGWCSGRRPSPSLAAPEPPGRLEFAVVVLFVALILALQAPRVERVIFEYAGMAAPATPHGGTTGMPCTASDLADEARTQRQALAALDRLEGAARRGEIDRAAFRRAIEQISVPGMPASLPGFGPGELLDLPRDPARPREPEDDRR
jgi:hypothetical protein